MAKVKTSSTGSRRPKPVAAKAKISLKRGTRYGCGGKIKK